MCMYVASPGRGVGMFAGSLMCYLVPVHEGH